MDLTIITPTINHLDNLKKLINYYQYFNYKGKIFFLDSSQKKIFLETKNYLKKNNNKNIFHYRILARPFECTKVIAPKIKTKYVCWSGDDDYFIVSGLRKSVKILNNNKKINALNGLTISANFKNKRKLIKSYVHYENFNSLHKKPINRLIQIFNEYRVPIFSVFRSNEFKKVMKYVPSKSNRRLCPTRIIQDEILESFLFVFFNKIYKFNYPFLIRTIPKKKYAQTSIDNFNRKKEFSLNQKRSIKYIEKIFLNLLNTKKEKFFLKEELDKYFKKNIIAKQKKYLIFYRGFKMQFRKYYDIFFNKNFKDILNFRNWLENN